MTKQQKEQIQYLLLQYMEGQASAEELDRLSVFLQEYREDGFWEELMEELFAAEQGMPEYREEEWQPLLEELIARNRQQKSNIRRMRFRWAAAAAAVIMLMATGSYFLFFNHRQITPPVGVTVLASDIKAPGANHATITLANGKKLYLDSADKGSLAMQHNVALIKTGDGQIIYQPMADSGSSTVQYNTLSNPRGSRVIDMTLADGSHVWLNAGSTVTYPVAFTGNERKVSVTGEAYFEVIHDPARPFIVSKGDVAITVLGTHFNVDAYDDEPAVKVTLLEGSIKVNAGKASGLLKPGDQSVFNIQHSAFNIQHNTDLEEVIAWKNGKFHFSPGTDLRLILRQVSRWYDIEVVYEDEVPAQQFGGEIPRSSNLGKVLEILKLSGVKFSIQNKKLIVMP